MSDLYQTLAEIHRKNSHKITYDLLNVSDYRKTFNKDENPECGICYKSVNTKVFVCAKPCNKTFHQACLETMIGHLESNADDAGQEDACYQCCYCRREFDINSYELELFVQKLMHFKSQGYNIGDAIQQATLNAITYEDDYNTSFQFDIYLPMDIRHVKVPKQSKRAEYKKTRKMMHIRQRGQRQGQRGQRQGQRGQRH